jgi:putative tryptophan/tyrosine transport system substrate-binding protein
VAVIGESGEESMRRRELIGFLGSMAVAWPLAARAQPSGRMRRIGVLMAGTAKEAAPQSWLAAFVEVLQKLGWTDGRTVHVDIRWNAGDAELAKIYAAELIGLMPDVILAASTTNLRAVREATSTVPVVFAQVSDPVAQGFVASMTNPGGNLTGFSAYEFSIGGKWLDLLKEAVPGLARVAVMFNPDTSPQSRFFMRAVEAAASSLGVRPVVAAVRTTAEIEPALASFASEPNGGLMLPTDSFTRLRTRLIAGLAIRYRLPSIAAILDFPDEGGLMFYGSGGDLLVAFRQAATYVDRILKGAKPADLPIQTLDKYTLSINLRTAKALGLALPLPLLGLADKIIE